MYRVESVRYILYFVLMVVTYVFVVLSHMDKVALASASTGIDFKLRQGFSAETSGMHMY